MRIALADDEEQPSSELACTPILPVCVVVAPPEQADSTNPVRDPGRMEAMNSTREMPVAGTVVR